MINLLSDFLLLFYFILGCYIALMGHLHNTIGLGFARGSIFVRVLVGIEIVVSTLVVIQLAK